MTLRELIAQRIRSEGPRPFAEFMELALYHPQLGYYARADRRSGRAGDFFTSVDLGSLFGELLAVQFAQLGEVLRGDPPRHDAPIDLVESAAGRGRLARDILDAAETSHPALYDAVRVTLVERSPTARAAQREILGRHQGKLRASRESGPDRAAGIVFANELLDALPVHPIVMTDQGLREVFVDVTDREPARFVERLGPPTATVSDHVARFDIRLHPGARGEVSPAVVSWIEEAGTALQRGFLVLIDYGHEAAELYSPTHATGTLTTYRRHHARTGDDTTTAGPWLDDPGDADITAHVDLTAVRTAAEGVGLRRVALVDQTYFILGLGAAELPQPADPVRALKRRLALKTLLMPGGLGSTHKVMIFSKNVDVPPLLGCAFAERVT